MLVRKVEVKTYHYTALCACGGEYKATGIALLSNPPKYPHECPNCGHEDTFARQFPYSGIEKILT